MTISDRLFKSLDCCTWTGCLLLFTKLFFPFCALWHFSVVSPARRAFGCSRFPDNEIPLFSAPACSDQGLQPGPVVVLSPSVWQGETDLCRDTGHTSWGTRSVYLYLQTKFHFNAIVWEGHEKWKATVKKNPKHSCAIRQILWMCSSSCQAVLEVMSGDSPVNKTGVCRAAPVEISFDVDPLRLTWPLISFSIGLLTQWR